MVLHHYRNPDSEIVKELYEMQHLYSNLEEEFLEFDKIIPYSHNPDNVFSPKLVNILQNIGPQIYGMFKIISKQLEITINPEKFPNYVQTIDEKELLSNQHVRIIDGGKQITPFEKEKTNYIWWDAYNSVKHELPKGIFEGTYGNVIKSLASLYILHHISDTIQREKNEQIEQDITDASNWLHVLTLGNYICYKTKTGRSSTLNETFQSKIFLIGKRFLPHLKNQEISPDYSRL